MTDQTLIKKIRDDLSEITIEKSSHEVLSVIHGLTRSINKLAMADEKKGKLLRKFAVDLMQAYTAEVQFHNLNASKNETVSSNKMRLSESFFRSFGILKSDMLAALDKLS